MSRGRWAQGGCWVGRAVAVGAWDGSEPICMFTTRREHVNGGLLAAMAGTQHRTDYRSASVASSLHCGEATLACAVGHRLRYTSRAWGLAAPTLSCRAAHVREGADGDAGGTAAAAGGTSSPGGGGTLDLAAAMAAPEGTAATTSGRPPRGRYGAVGVTRARHRQLVATRIARDEGGKPEVGRT